jgi:hypothetical protein
MLSRSAGFHLSSWAMFPWRTATRTGSPADASSLRLMRAAPQTAIAATTRPDAASGSHRARLRSTIAYAAAADVSASSADKPYTPKTLASWATGSTVIWL